MRAGQIFSLLLMLASTWLLFVGGRMVYRVKSRPTGDIADIYAQWLGWGIVAVGATFLLSGLLALVAQNRLERKRKQERDWVD